MSEYIILDKKQEEQKKLTILGSGKLEEISAVSNDSYNEAVESNKYAEQYKKLIERVLPNIDTREPSTFAFYGSAEKYYENSFRYIQNSYPYDGSRLEKVEWSLSASAIDLAVLQHEYPKETGFVNFGSSGWGELSDSSGRYGLSSNPEYIKFSGGPYVGSVYNASTGRESGLKINPVQGNTLEFWLKKDEFATAKTDSEVIFDSYTIDSAEGNSLYGRFLLELSASSGSPFYLTYMSGTTGTNRAQIGAGTTAATVADGNWHHYAFVVFHSSSHLYTELYVDGKYDSTKTTSIATMGNVEGYFNGTIGALATAKDSQGALGYGKLQGSIDELRFWKKKRNAKDIGNHYDFPVHGATDKEQINSVLGLYYKFNEGVLLDPAVDKVVLDYSGRINNGTFVGYSTSSRSTGSAITLSQDSITTEKELGDPIINPKSSKVISALQSLTEIATSYDEYNNSSIFKSVPQWAYETKAGSSNIDSEFSILLQAIASKFDSIKLLIDGIPKLGFKTYSDFTFARGSVNYNQNFGTLLGCESDFDISFSNLGETDKFSVQNLLSRNFDVLELPIVNKSNIDEYLYNLKFSKTDPTTGLGSFLIDSKSEDIKNKILNSVYVNLQKIYNTKGTLSSFRNLMRCFGVDEKLISPNMYGNNVEIPIDDKPFFEPIDINSISLKDKNNEVTLFQTSSTSSDARHYIQGKNSGPITFEARMIFPEMDLSSVNPTTTNTSIFGLNRTETTHIGIPASNHCGFRISAIKKSLHHKSAYFTLSSSAGIFDEITTDYFNEVYKNSNWHFSVRFSEDTSLKLSNFNVKNNKKYKVEFNGYNYDLDVLLQSFSLSSSISQADYSNFIQSNKNVFLGAERTDITGSLSKKTECKFLNFNAWDDYLEESELKVHAQSYDNLGRRLPMNYVDNNQGGDSLKGDTLILNWQFENVSFNDSKSIVNVVDSASGSLENVNILGPIKGYKYPGSTTPYGSKSKIVDKEHLSNVVYKEVSNLISRPRVVIKKREIDVFELDSRPISYIFSYEKSMFQIISRQMLKMISGVSSFNNLIGEAIYKYRRNYKSLENLREKFYREVENDIDFERFVEFYKWIDSSLGKMLQQLQPASSDMNLGIQDVIESHAFERNKYGHKLPNFEFKDPKIEGQILGINELLYDWEHGHSPPPVAATATIRLTGQPLKDETITITSTDGTSLTYSAKTTANSTARTFDFNNGEFHALRSLREAILDSTPDTGGHAGKIHVALLGVLLAPFDMRLVLTQTAKGVAGNTTITHNLSNATITNFTGGAGLDQSKNCLWWQDRAERDGVLAIPNAPNNNREILRERTNNISVSGSTYVLRKLIRPYKFTANKQLLLNMGSNRNANKIKEFYKIVNSKPEKQITLSKDDIYEFKKCDDVINPQKERLYVAKTNTTGTSGYMDVDADMAFPFSLYSSSAETRQDFSIFKQGLALTNNHDDQISSMQGPFVRENVGGMPHRRVKFGIDRDERPEAYTLTANSDSFTLSRAPIDEPKSQVSLGVPRVYNVSNIKTDTISNLKKIGNYDKIYEIVQIAGRKLNNRLLTISGSIPSHPIKIGKIKGIIDYKIADRPRSEHIFVSKFSAPGGPETQAASARDFESGELSIYNTINYRNLSVREPLNRLHGEDVEKFGYRAGRHEDTAATATITFTGDPTANQTITITSTDGTSLTYSAKNSGNSASRTFDCNNGGVTSATTLKAAIEDSTAGTGGHAGKITVSRDGATLTLTQASKGKAGNTKIISGLANTTVVSFTGGSDSVPSVHMTNRNFFHSVVDNEIDNDALKPDNFYFQHPIPQNDIQYGWITSSTITKKVDFVESNLGFGHQHMFTTGSKKNLEFTTSKILQNPILIQEFIGSGSVADSNPANMLGYSIASHGKYVAVGEPDAVIDGFREAGKVHIYKKHAGKFKEIQVLQGSDARSGTTSSEKQFGFSVAMKKNIIAVGSRQSNTGSYDDGHNAQGKVAIFERLGGSQAWTQTKELGPPTSHAQTYSYFGQSLEFSPDGETLIIGAPEDDTVSSNHGAIIVFDRSKQYEFTHFLTSSAGTANSQLGFAMSFGKTTDNIETIAAGAHRLDSNKGKVEIFEYKFIDSSTGTTWRNTQSLVALDGSASDDFGYSVDMEGDYLVVGAPGDNSDLGSAYIFQKIKGSWKQIQKIKPRGVDGSYRIGYKVSIKNKVIYLGGFVNDSDAQGAVLIYETVGRGEDKWAEVKSVLTTDYDRITEDATTDIEAFSIELHPVEETLFVGASQTTVSSNIKGSLYIFERQGKSWADVQVNYAGVNLGIVEEIDIDNNTLRPITKATINQLILHRQGPYGWPTWKQVRGSQHPVTRLLRKNNIHSTIYYPPPQVLEGHEYNKKAVFLDGNSLDATYLQINQTRTIFKNSSGISLFAWVKHRQTDDNESHNLFAINTRTGGNRFAFAIKGNQAFTFDAPGALAIYQTPNVGWKMSSGARIDDNEWHHIGFTYKELDATSGEIELFVDGKSQGEKISIGAFSAIVDGQNDSVSIGHEFDSGGTSDFWRGYIADFAIWDKQLTDVEVAELLKHTGRYFMKTPVTTGVFPSQFGAFIPVDPSITTKAGLTSFGPIDLSQHSCFNRLQVWYRMGDGTRNNLKDSIKASKLTTVDSDSNIILNNANPGARGSYHARPTGSINNQSMTIVDVRDQLPGTVTRLMPVREKGATGGKIFLNDPLPDHGFRPPKALGNYGTAEDRFHSMQGPIMNRYSGRSSANNPNEIRGWLDATEPYERTELINETSEFFDESGLGGDRNILTSKFRRKNLNYKDIPVTKRFYPIVMTVHSENEPTLFAAISPDNPRVLPGESFQTVEDPRSPSRFRARHNIEEIDQFRRELSWNLDQAYYASFTNNVSYGKKIDLWKDNPYLTPFGQVSIRKTFQNDITSFAEMLIMTDSQAKERKNHFFFPLFHNIIKKNDEQNKKLIEINYIEKIYPREINTFTKSAREREQFDFHGWKKMRHNRNVLLSGNVNHFSDEPLLKLADISAFPSFTVNNKKDHKRSFFTEFDAVDVRESSTTANLPIVCNISASVWPLDSRKTFTELPTEIGQSYFNNQNSFLESRDQGTRAEGILQNDFSTFPLGYNGLYGTPPFSMVYNRRVPQSMLGVYNVVDDVYNDEINTNLFTTTDGDNSSIPHRQINSTDITLGTTGVTHKSNNVYMTVLSGHTSNPDGKLNIVEEISGSTNLSIFFWASRAEIFSTGFESTDSSDDIYVEYSPVSNFSSGVTTVTESFKKSSTTTEAASLESLSNSSAGRIHKNDLPNSSTLNYYKIDISVPANGGFYRLRKESDASPGFGDTVAIFQFGYSTQRAGEFLAGEAMWEAASGTLGPFYDSYQDYAFNDIRPIAQDHSVIPEFRMSQFVEEVLNDERTYHDRAAFFATVDLGDAEAFDITDGYSGIPMAAGAVGAFHQVSAREALSYWPDFLSLTGAIHQVSSGDVSIGGQFFKTYSNSDFLKYFQVVDNEITKVQHPISHARLTLKCKAAMKFLPYKGFYPAERVVEICELFHKNYLNDFVLQTLSQKRNDSDIIISKTNTNRYLNLRANASRYQVSKPLFGPGVLMNSIKTGVAVDYPIFTGSFDTVSTRLPTAASLTTFSTLNISKDTTFTGSLINGTRDDGVPRIKSSVTKRVSFEDMMNPSNLFGTEIFDNEPHPSASLQYGTKHWNRIIERPAKFGTFEEDSLLDDLGVLFENTKIGFANQISPYTRAIHNFAAETVNFFVQDGHLTTLISKPIDEYFVSGQTHKMRVRVTNVNNVMYDRHSAFGPPVDDSGDGLQLKRLTLVSQPQNASLSLTLNDPQDYASLLSAIVDVHELPALSASTVDNSTAARKVIIKFYSAGAAWTVPPSDNYSDDTTSANEPVLYVNIDTPNAADTEFERKSAMANSIKAHIDRSDAVKNYWSTSVIDNVITISPRWFGTANNVAFSTVNADTVDVLLSAPEPSIFAESSAISFSGGVAENEATYVSDTQTITSSHGYMPYVPPFLDPDSSPYVEISFTPTETKNYSAEEIIQNSTYEYYNFKVTPNNASTNTNYQEAMSLSASLNLGICTRLHTDNFNVRIVDNHESIILSNNRNANPNPRGELNGPPLQEGFDESLGTPKDRWVIQTKWETPVLDFGDAKASALNIDDNTIQQVTGSPWKDRYWSSYYVKNANHREGTEGSFLTGSTGMWHQKGKIIDGNPNSNDVKGYFLTAEDVEGHGGLATKLGFIGNTEKRSGGNNLKLAKTFRKRIGPVEDRKMVKEAVVAIPYTVKTDISDELSSPGTAFGGSSRNQIRFIELDNDRYFRAARNLSYLKNEFSSYAISNRVTSLEDYIGLASKYKQKTENYISEAPINAIEYQILMMQQFVLPPALDFLLTKKQPIMMYFFQFRASFDKEDISNIWQNLYPKSNSSAAKARYSCVEREFGGRLTPLKDVSYVSHYLDTRPLNNQGNLSPAMNVYDLFQPARIDAGQNKEGAPSSQTRWLVFKVKQRAMTNLEQIRKRSVDPRLNNIDKFEYVKESFSSDGTQVRIDEPQYSGVAFIPPEQPDPEPVGDEAAVDPKVQFNWPYDYFSFVELIKLEAKIDSYTYNEPPGPVVN